MKKILMGTVALMFAGSSAFAAGDVSILAFNAYSKETNDDSSIADKKFMYTEVEAYLSVKKTSSSGLTFGATYTIGFDGDKAKVEGTPSTLEHTTANVIATVVPTTQAISGTTAVTGLTTTNGEVVDSITFTKGTKSQYAAINTFVSGSFGKVEMGYHNVASRAIGASSLEVGNFISGAFTTVLGTREKTLSGITYTSPSFSGIQAAYTYEPGTDKANSLAVKYQGNISGFKFAAAYGTYKPAKTAIRTAPKSNFSYGLKVAKGPFAVSYSAGTLKKENIEVGFKNDVKSTRFGVSYTMGKIQVGAAQRTLKVASSTNPSQDAVDAKYLTINASYKLASGLDLFVESQKISGFTADKDNTRTTYIGTRINF